MGHGRLPAEHHPNTLVDAFAKGEILQVLLIAVLFGFALHRFGGRGTLVFDVIEKGSHVLFTHRRLHHEAGAHRRLRRHGLHHRQVRRGLAVLAGQADGHVLRDLPDLHLRGAGHHRALPRLQVWKFIKYIKEELLIVLGTSSSESVLPRMMEKMENLGAQDHGGPGDPDRLLVQPRRHLHLPDDGGGVHRAGHQHADDAGAGDHAAGVLLLTSKGAAGVTGSGFIVLAATLSAVGHVPVAGLALILGIDRFMSEARALTNLIGNGVATLVVAKWTNELDEKRLQAALNNETWRSCSGSWRPSCGCRRWWATCWRA
jgi:aerobic C4-dicarboxylate transport protein